ncbi:unnamed protein product [Eruca vesicaria subsp. sativa]|uniref:RING-type domain-containing protein n=1 Tax=Eruca vesicaria subsp. sativa TaxID=29727 RepID=A0ABC8JTS8_ERUVS|nr:unnamed protein product [Eruca vesicaria subsp. sativa]
MSKVFWVLSHKSEPSLPSPKRNITVEIKRPRTWQTGIVIHVALRAVSNGHLNYDTVREMEYMLLYHDFDFDLVMEIIEETSDFVARTIPTIEDPTCTDLDIFVKISDQNPDSLQRITLTKLCVNRRGPLTTEEDDICPICCEKFGTGGEINSLDCFHSYHRHCILKWAKTNLTCPYCRPNLV